MDDNRGNPTNQTNIYGFDFSPKWSPDGQFVAFRSDRDGKGDIFVMNADGSNPENVTKSPDTEEDDFVWSLDSQQIVVVSALGGDTQLYHVNRDGKARTQLTHVPGNASAPAWVY